MRRVYLRGRENIWKRQLIHVGAFDLGLVRKNLGTARVIETLFIARVAAVAIWMATRPIAHLTSWRSCELKLPGAVLICEGPRSVSISSWSAIWRLTGAPRASGQVPVCA